MWIRSLSKSVLVNANAFNVTFTGEIYGYVGNAESMDEGFYLGTYSSEKMAIDVLDYIRAKIIFDTLFMEMPTEEQILKIKEGK